MSEDSLQLTRDEQYLRAYFLSSDITQQRSRSRELAYIVPAIVVAGLALANGTQAGTWAAFIYLLGLYLWRFGSNRWGAATRSLIEKYEARIRDLEGEGQPT
jgi:hypothetical protein